MQKMNLKALLLITVFLGMIYAEVSFVIGVQGASLNVGPTSRANFNDSNGALYQAQAGNVTQINIDGNTITTHWAGFYGNISGNVTLEDSNGNKFYDWSGLGVPIGEVFAANQSTVLWGGIGCANSTEIPDINTFFGMSVTDSDRIQNTFTLNNHPEVDIANNTLTANTCNTTNAYSNGVADAGLYTQILLTDAVGIPVFTTLINDSATGFNGAPFDFELLAGAKPSELTPLYFYVELG